jgi:biopolymer transport protein TolR
MGMSVGGGGDESVVSEINVTPLVDVMLVLLIIFMIAAPMLVQGLDVNLPQVTAQAMDSKKERLIVTLTKDKAVLLDEVQVNRENLIDKIKAVLASKADQQVYLRADEEVTYGFVVEIMAALREAGVQQLGMVTEPVGAKRPADKAKDKARPKKGA